MLKIIKKGSFMFNVVTILSFMMGCLLFMTTGSAFAVSYYEAGSVDNKTYGPGIMEYYLYKTTTPTISFQANQISGPGGDNLVGNYQCIPGIYTLIDSGTSGVYNLVKNGGGTSTVMANDGGVPRKDFFGAFATALLINFNDHTITWTDFTHPTYQNTDLKSSSLTDMAALTSTGSSLRFTTFTFEQRDGELAWLSGTGVAANVRYYSKREGGALPQCLNRENGLSC
ncbi:MAG: hypothetical protein WCO89_06315 [Syntrophus sp. (in: bacteria)]